MFTYFESVSLGVTKTLALTYCIIASTDAIRAPRSRAAARSRSPGPARGARRPCGTLSDPTQPTAGAALAQLFRRTRPRAFSYGLASTENCNYVRLRAVLVELNEYSSRIRSLGAVTSSQTHWSVRYGELLRTRTAVHDMRALRPLLRYGALTPTHSLQSAINTNSSNRNNTNKIF